MCTATIVDTNALHKALVSKKQDGDSTFRSWIKRRDGVLVYAPSGDYREELRKNLKVMALMESYRQKNHAKLISAAALSASKKQLQGRRIQSNDRHVLALALASDALVLCSDDKGLCADFNNTEVLPKIGRQARAIYPTKATKKKREEFLGKRKCSKRN